MIKAISQIPGDAWTAIEYPNAILDEETGQWVSEAEVAETTFIAFVSKKTDQQVACRLVVRRVKRLNDAVTCDQGELFTAYRHHAFITNTTLCSVEADAFHRAHAIVEQVIAELKARPLAHLPSGKLCANAARLTFAVMAFNTCRAAALAAGTGTARTATVLRTIIATPARIATTGRRLIMHLPTRWPWQQAWTNPWETAARASDVLTTQPQRARPENPRGKAAQSGRPRTPIPRDNHNRTRPETPSQPSSSRCARR